MRLRPFAKAAAVALLVAALQPPASAALPQQTASDERNFDESVKAFQTSLAVLSTKPNDLFTFNVKGWTDNHNKMTGRLLDRSSVVWDDYRSLDADGMEQSTPAKKCELYALARNGVVVGHGLPYSKNAMQAALTQTNTLRAWLGGLEHEFETQLLEGQLSGKKAAGTAQLQARVAGRARRPESAGRGQPRAFVPNQRIQPHGRRYDTKHARRRLSGLSEGRNADAAAPERVAEIVAATAAETVAPAVGRSGAFTLGHKS